MNNPFFSIIIPTYNRSGFIKKTIDSVLEQEYQDFEILVIDDGSTDNTEEVVKSISDNRLIYVKKKNEERAVARNTGTRIAKGKYINFFDSDDILYPNHLRTALNLIAHNSNPEFFHLAYDIKDDKGNFIKKRALFKSKLNKEIILGNLLSCNGVFLRKDIARQFPFNEDRMLSASEDWELWIRLSARLPLLHSNIVTSTIINHDLRSVLTINKQALIKRMDLLYKYLFEDEMVITKYSQYKNLFRANIFTYMALHLALTKKHRLDVLFYLFRSLLKSFGVLKTRRFYGALKHFI